MRLVRFRIDGGAPRAAVLAGDAVLPLEAPSVEALAASADSLKRVREAASAGRGKLSLAEVSLEPPLRPSVVVAPGPWIDPGAGRGLELHREFYLKSAHTVIGPKAPVPYSDALGVLSYRAQLGLVFAPTGRHANAGSILDRLLGAVLAAELYSVDLLRPGWEGSMWHTRYGEGASFDGACPTSDVFVTADELELDGFVLEDAAGAWTVERGQLAEFAAYVSNWLELVPGVLFLVGSPHGPSLTLDGTEPVIRFADEEPRLGPGDRVWARSNSHGEIDAPIERRS